jgi:hypothetical protein
VLALASLWTGVVSGSDVSMTRVRSQALVNAIIKPPKKSEESCRSFPAGVYLI